MPIYTPAGFRFNVFVISSLLPVCSTLYQMTFCSTIIPTIGRPTLSRAVCSALEQRFGSGAFEIIVVNDSGQPLPAAEWQQAKQVRVINTSPCERSLARNAGAALAHGRYLHFLDDDDWLLPGAFSHFWQLAQSNQAAWLYGRYNYVDAAGQVLEACHPDEEGNCLVRLVAGEWLPLQASLIDSQAFFNAGGFEPWLIPYQDNDLAMRIILQGETAVTPARVANIVRSPQDSVTDYSKLSANMRRSRETLLRTPGVFSRLRDSAASRPVHPAYWHGRITAAYLLSLGWNLRRQRPFTAASRGSHALASVALAGKHLLSPHFWKGAMKSHVTRGFFRQQGIG